MTYTLEKKQITDNACDNKQLSNLTHKDFKVSIINMTKELNKIITKKTQKNV